MIIQQLTMVAHFILAITILVIVLLQHGKGADVGATFGGGASNTFFGSQGSSGFLYKLTWALGVLFCVTSITLTYFASTHHKKLLPGVPQQTISQPAKPVPSSTTDVPIKTDSKKQ
jgi:preprotein translocase subunit SecG